MNRVLWLEEGGAVQVQARDAGLKVAGVMIGAVDLDEVTQKGFMK